MKWKDIPEDISETILTMAMATFIAFLGVALVFAFIFIASSFLGRSC